MDDGIREPGVVTEMRPFLFRTSNRAGMEAVDDGIGEPGMFAEMWPLQFRTSYKLE